MVLGVLIVQNHHQNYVEIKIVNYVTIIHLQFVIIQKIGVEKMASNRIRFLEEIKKIIGLIVIFVNMIFKQDLIIYLMDLNVLIVQMEVQKNYVEKKNVNNVLKKVLHLKENHNI